MQKRGLCFVTAGDVSTNWWTEPLGETKEGNLLVRVEYTSFI